jgi:TonB family protein
MGEGAIVRATRWKHATSIMVLLAVTMTGAIQLRAQSSSSTDEKRPLKHLVQPEYPELAKKLNLTGTVRIEVTISPDGTVKRSKVLGGHPLLASEAERAAQKTTFQPGPKETIEIIDFKF